MSQIARPFAYNPSPNPLIDGTDQVGSLAVGMPTSGFTNSPQFWNGPDESLGYVIAYPVSGGTHPTPIPGVFAYVGFLGTKNMTNPLSESTFVELTNSSFNQNFTTGTDASTWLTANGYWNSWIPLTLGWDDITNADLLVGDATDVADWNTFFDLPTNGTPFTSVTVVGNDVNLYGGSNIHLSDSLFSDNYNLVSVVDNVNCITTAAISSFLNCNVATTFNLPALTTAGDGCFNQCDLATTFNLPALTTAGDGCFTYCYLATTFNLPALTTAGDSCFNGCYLVTTFDLPALTTAGDGCFNECSSVTTFNLPALTTAGNGCFNECESVTTFDLPSCTNLGSTTGNNNVFNGISSNVITLTIPASRMTCNSGNPDGDIQYLQENNTVTVITT
jgi:hypothetical protein